MRKRLAVVGAGPKAAAIVARATVLRELLGDARVPEIIVLERDRVGAAWDGEGQYSNGFLTLCTPGEKDVGFPYRGIDRFGMDVSVAQALYADYSWGAYLVAAAGFADWVDRDRDHPSHARFAAYLRWVFERAGIEPLKGEVDRIRAVDGKWCVECADRQFVVDGVVLSGNGEPRGVPMDAAVPPDRVLDAETFWPHRQRLIDTSPLTVAVIGDGGSAGSIAAWLADRFRETGSTILSVSPMGTLFPRGDGHAERRWFSDPDKWPDLSFPHRRRLIERTEASVVSMRNKRILDHSTQIVYKAGYLDGIALDPDGRPTGEPLDRLALSVTYADGAPRTLSAHYVVNAIGFDPWSRLKIVHQPIAQQYAGTTFHGAAKALRQIRERVEEAVTPDLVLSDLPGIHVPALAGVAQGPGMGNLGCLGSMAARVLDPYVDWPPSMVRH